MAYLSLSSGLLLLPAVILFSTWSIVRGYGSWSRWLTLVGSCLLLIVGLVLIPVAPNHAEIKASGRNLTGQSRQIELREILEPEGAVYYIGELPVHNMETYRFNIEVRIAGESEPLVVKFKQQFYTE